MSGLSSHELTALVAENNRRLALLDEGEYDPARGVGCCGERVEAHGGMVPAALMAEHPEYRMMAGEELRLARDRLRVKYDFEFWCVRCARIRIKGTGQVEPFVLNSPQRRLLAVMEGQRTAGQPVRVILLKARQWGGSTLVQMYMAWMQLVRHTGWNSFICGHRQSTSKGIKRMYNLLLRRYPPEMLPDEVPRGQMLHFSKLEGQPNVQQIEARDSLVITGSSLSEDAVRGYDITMAHLSEVAFWKTSAMHSPDDLVRSVCGSVALRADTVVVLESTANGVGNYFHDMWLMSEMGRTDKATVFVPWHAIGMYRLPCSDIAALWQAMDDYERRLWDEDKLTLEQINWYHHKRLEYRSQAQMMAEYPGSPSEAFTATGNNPFKRDELDRLALNCRRPLLTGDIQGAGLKGLPALRDVHLVEVEGGALQVWERPDPLVPRQRGYLVVVDVGGRAEGSDYSVIAVMRRPRNGNDPTAVVAQWRGHIDHDELGWKAAQLALLYNHALLVVECNTLVNEAAREGESEYILSNIYQFYPNLYKRDRKKLGFHTNRKTKREAIAALIKEVRDCSYIERDMEAVNEMRTYEERDNRYEAALGKHDDILMTRAIGLLAIMEEENKRGTGHDTLPLPGMFTGSGIAVRVK